MKQGNPTVRRGAWLAAASLSAVLGIWAVLAYSGSVKPLFLPAPHKVFLSFGEMYREGILFSYTWDSVYRVMVGWSLAAVIAVPLGLLIATSRRASHMVAPVMEFARYLPVVALVPLTLLYFGIGDAQKFAIIFLGTFFQLVLMVADSVATVPADLSRAAATLGANRLQTYRLVLFPGALPGIMDDLRITVGWAWTYLVVAELVAANSGLGYMILRAQRFLAIDRIFAGLIIIGVLGLLTDYLFKLLTRIITPWSEKR
ncbi:binding-protein-dependent transport systems inner membrane component [Pseudodesulfovibrio mercurii]|uniref:Binding-protein-dependent transport systems inner membrane component n=1 Tax=Pseudodesulfovibrio mercurii TaxID=641491 RepID=F0JJG1_9BACT|nr:ABC transporter permease [Pseudodesulfovibrio mercurii]EGB16060.1 binding-protein-dependent transport systems inner membrane component [Pseudodesulfovibrio mercurii]